MRAMLAVGCVAVLIVLFFLIDAGEDAPTLEVFAGSASKPALEECARLYESENDLTIDLHFSGSGTMLSQMKMTGRGDLYIPGSPDYMEIAVRDGVVEPDTISILAYNVPVIAVQKGNPKNITSLDDLLRDDVRVGIGDPRTVCLGLYSVELLEHNGISERMRDRMKVYAESCSKAASLLAFGSVDAVIGWRVFGAWNPEKIDIIHVQGDRVPRISYIPAAISTFTRDRARARDLLDFLGSDACKRVFSENDYLSAEAEARQYAPTAQLGGLYALPAGWSDG
ncbi:MAG: molybdate ABC transporter substrate-binding protein [Candidatus Undinarchaeales archaeon]|jgi:molybdate transport system substrate-binding protein|nr:molybdate ABC transporter substrate-binding protein [Candidatus Undinarchaeales archaeon]MDP7494615.1 molybdate ABC transporter substrate-binding protein [Candidatus Undinarchaeales archaeon]